MGKTISREIRLASRPQGMPVPQNFTLASAEVGSPQKGQVLVRNLFMSVDPYMRGRMKEGKSYVPPFEIGKPLEGGAVAQLGGVIGPHYAASKAGCLGLTLSYAALLAKEGITVNAIAPALIETEMIVSNPKARADTSYTISPAAQGCVRPASRATVERTAAAACGSCAGGKAAMACSCVGSYQRTLEFYPGDEHARADMHFNSVLRLSAA